MTDREKLLYALAAVLTDRPRLPMEQLAREVGISRATLHRSFPTREAILVELLQLALEVAMRTIEDADLEHGPADEALVRLIDASIPNVALHLFLSYDRGEDCPARPATDARWEPHRQRILALFRRGQEEGVFRVDLSAQWMLDSMGALMFAAAEGLKRGRLAPADAVAAVAGMMLDGVRRHPVAGGSPSAPKPSSTRQRDHHIAV